MSTAFIIVISIIVAFVIYLAYASYRMKKAPSVANHEKIKVLNDSNFKQHIAGGITLVDFWAEWCMPCKMMAPILNEVASEAPDGVKVAKLKVDHAKQIAGKYNVRSIPTIIVFKNGKEVKRIVGVKQKGFILNQIKDL
ncbi:MAG: thioredoxin [Bacteroidota bacterium]